MVSRIISTNSVMSWDFPTTVSNCSPASIHRRHFSEDPFSADDKEILNISPLTKEPNVQQDIREEINLLSSSNSSIVLNSITPSTSTSLHHTSPPSSYAGSTGPSHGVQEKFSEPPVSIADNTNQRAPVSSELGLLAQSPGTPIQQCVPSTTPIASTSQQRLWHKIKINVRPPSRDEGLDNSARKERGKIGDIFTSASKGLLPSRSLIF